MRKNMNIVKRLTWVIVTILTICMLPATAVSSATVTGSSDGEIIGVTLRTFKKTVAYPPANDRRKNVIIPTDKRLEILNEADGYFLVEYSNRYLWIKTDDCLINIAEYIPSLEINLVMSEDENLFRMADEEIPGISDTRFYFESGARNGTECWLRYRAAKNLLKAEKAFLKDGYTIVVYDAYRPYSVSVAFKEAYHEYLMGKSTQFKNEWFGELGESWFLAQKPGSHNFGNAVDMTLMNIYTGEELEMPAAMHGLDKRSAFYMWSGKNTTASKNALYMKKQMEAVGFSYLKSEWWHFQDNTVPNDLIDIAI